MAKGAAYNEKITKSEAIRLLGPKFFFKLTRMRRRMKSI